MSSEITSQQRNIIGIYANNSPLLAIFVVSILDEFSIASLRRNHAFITPVPKNISRNSVERRNSKQTRLIKADLRVELVEQYKIRFHSRFSSSALMLKRADETANEHESNDSAEAERKVAKCSRTETFSARRVPLRPLAANETLQLSRLRMMQRLGINESITRRPESIFSDSAQLMSVNRVCSPPLAIIKRDWDWPEKERDRCCVRLRGRS